MLKRAMRNGRTFLKKMAFFLITLSLVKICIFDVRILQRDLFCDLETGVCDTHAMHIFLVAGFGVLIVTLYALYQYYGIAMRRRMQASLTPEEAGVPFWSNLAMSMVCLMVIWQMAPWVGYLTIGSIPKLFLIVPWQVLAIVNLGLLLNGFWRSENCIWDYDVANKKELVHLNKTWTPRDTLWMAVFIYLITLGLSYVAHDVLSIGVPAGAV